MRFLRSLMTLALVCLVVVLGVIVWRHYTVGVAPTLEDPTAEATETVSMPPLEFGGEEETAAPGEIETPANAANMTLTVAGDIVCHTGLNAEALQDDGSYDYTQVFGDSASYIAAADYATTCLETTFPTTTDYTGYPMFKSPTGLASTLANLGFDLISTASNHCMDSYQSGLIATLDTLDANGLAHVGTYRTQEERDANSGITVSEVNGISIAWVAYTYGTNGLPVTGFEYAVNLIFTDYMDNLSIIDYDSLEADMEAARNLNTDLIIVYMHWGNEYYTTPVDYQYELADYLFQQGADIILGGHTHVPEPMELRTVTDLDGNEKTGFICYSLGNYVSCQNDRYTNLTAIININIEKNLDTGETYIRDVSYVPMFMVDLEDYGIYNAGWRYQLWDLHAAISDYESGNDRGVINDTLYNALLQGVEDIHSIFGAELDASYTG